MLLARLFSEIDLNDNGSMEWAEFCNYIIHNSNSVGSAGGGSENPSFLLRLYSESKDSLENVITKDPIKDNISLSFYIQKLNMIGVVKEFKSYIHFYDATVS